MKKKGGILGTLGSILWVLFAIGILLAIAGKLGVGNVDEVLDMAKEKAIYYSECIPAKECGIVPIVEDINPSDLIINQDINLDKKGSGNQGNSTNTGQTNGIVPKESILNRETKGYRGPSHDEPYVTEIGLMSKKAATEMLELLKLNNKTDENDNKKGKKDKKKEPKIDFNVEEWNYWVSDENRECWNTKEKVLSRDVKEGTAHYLDKSLNESDVSTACTMGIITNENGIRSINRENVGEWICPYTGETITSPNELVIDHVVTLEYANQNGGHEWTKEKKEDFANDMDNLLAVSKKGYKEKNNKGLKYSPNLSYKCQYAKNVTGILHKYELEISEADKKQLGKALRTCQN